MPPKPPNASSTRGGREPKPTTERVKKLVPVLRHWKSGPYFGPLREAVDRARRILVRTPEAGLRQEWRGIERSIAVWCSAKDVPRKRYRPASNVVNRILGFDDIEILEALLISHQSPLTTEYGSPPQRIRLWAICILRAVDTGAELLAAKANSNIDREFFEPAATKGKQFMPGRRRGSETRLTTALREILANGRSATLQQIIESLRKHDFVQDIDSESRSVAWRDDQGKEHDATFKTIGNKVSLLRRPSRTKNPDPR